EDLFEYPVRRLHLLDDWTVGGLDHLYQLRDLTHLRLDTDLRFQSQLTLDFLASPLLEGLRSLSLAGRIPAEFVARLAEGARLPLRELDLLSWPCPRDPPGHLAPLLSSPLCAGLEELSVEAQHPQVDLRGVLRTVASSPLAGRLRRLCVPHSASAHVPL